MNFSTFVKFIQKQIMKRYALLFSFLMFCLLIVEANPVTKTQALQEAKQFLLSKGIVMSTTNEAYRSPRKANARTDNSSLYIYNVGNDQGFVIVSGDDRTEKILGYVDAGSFDESDVPAPLKEWLHGYEKEIESLVTIEQPNVSKRRAIEKTKKPIPPMTTSNWGHGYPYNSKTPVFSGENAPTGCSPSIFAQFLYFYRDKNVKATTAEIPAYTANDISLSAVPAGTKLDWDNMLDEYTYKSGYTTAQREAVANLEFYAGKAMETQYYKSTSLTKTSNFHPALINYFGFDSKIAYIDREYYSVDDWEDVIYNEVANHRPVVYNAFSTSAGHTLLVDGYDSSGLFHINWGWGKSNGYFRLSVLNRYHPGSNTFVAVASTYPDRHSALLYAVPASMGCVNTSNYQLNGAITSAYGNTISCKYHNQSGDEGYYQYGIGFVDDNDNVVLVSQFNNYYAYLNHISTATRYYTLTETNFQNAGLSYGTYELVPVYRYREHSEWKACQHESANFAIVNYSASGISSSIHSNFTNITVADIEFVGDGLNNSEQKVEVTLSNNSDEHSYFGKVYLFANTTTTMGDYLKWAAYHVNKSERITIQLPFTPSEAGTYNIWIATDEYGDEIIGQSKLTIDTITASKLVVNNTGYSFRTNYWKTVDKVKYVKGNTIDLYITNIKNTSDNPIYTRFSVWLRQYDSVSSTSWNNSRFQDYGDNAKFYYVDTVIPAHSDNFMLPVLFENLKYNTKYAVYVAYPGGAVKTTPAILCNPALITWKADGTNLSYEPVEAMTIDKDVIAVDIIDATDIKSITPNNNPNVLYYMGASQTVPAGLANANVVKGNVADKITLRDSCDFYVPKTFTAKNISFTTTPSIGAKSGSNRGWNTIALPFDVTSVKNTTDNKAIDWFHAGETADKDFWVRGFERLDNNGDIIFLDNVDQMEAYVPYLYNVPSDYWGKKYNLCGKALTFYGENATLYKDMNMGLHSSAYNLIGTTIGKTIENAWFINPEGNAFIYANSQIVPAFHAYFVDSNQYFSSFVSPKEMPVLHIKFQSDDENTTAIMAPIATSANEVNVYNLQGVKVATLPLHNGTIDLHQLPKGIYMVGGKKVIR